MAERKRNYSDVLKESGYRKLLVSTMINRFGDSLDAVAFAWLVYQVTRSGTWSAIIFGMNILPNVIIQPFAGAIVERLDKKRVIVLTHIFRALLLIGFLMLYLSGRCTGWIMAGFTFAVTSIEAFNMPAGTAFIPKVLRKEMLTCGMSLNTMMSGTVTLVGTGISGIIIAGKGVYAAILIDVITFFIAAFLIMLIKTEKETTEDYLGKKNEPYLTAFREGLRYIRGESIILNYCLIAVLLNMILVPVNALQAPLVSECYQMGSEFLSVLGMAGSVGAILGSALIPAVRKRLSVKKTVLLFSFLLGLEILLLPWIGMFVETPMLKYHSAGTCFAVMTLASGLISGVINIEFVSLVDKRFIARTSAVFVSLSTAAIPVTSMLVGLVKTVCPTETLISLCGIGTIILMIVLWVMDPSLDAEKEKTYATEAA